MHPAPQLAGGMGGRDSAVSLDLPFFGLLLLHARRHRHTLPPTLSLLLSLTPLGLAGGARVARPAGPSLLCCLLAACYAYWQLVAAVMYVTTTKAEKGRSFPLPILVCTLYWHAYLYPKTPPFFVCSAYCARPFPCLGPVVACVVYSGWCALTRNLTPKSEYQSSCRRSTVYARYPSLSIKQCKIHLNMSKFLLANMVFYFFDTIFGSVFIALLALPTAAPNSCAQGVSFNVVLYGYFADAGPLAHVLYKGVVPDKTTLYSHCILLPPPSSHHFRGLPRFPSSLSAVSQPVCPFKLPGAFHALPKAVYCYWSAHERPGFLISHIFLCAALANSPNKSRLHV